MSFQGLGCLPGDYHIEVDPDVRPVQHMPRNVPVAVQQELNMVSEVGFESTPPFGDQNETLLRSHFEAVTGIDSW